MHYQGALLLLIITHQLALMKKYRGQDGPHILIATPASATEKEKKKKNSVAQLVNSLDWTVYIFLSLAIE